MQAVDASSRPSVMPRKNSDKPGGRRVWTRGEVSLLVARWSLDNRKEMASDFREGGLAVRGLGGGRGGVTETLILDLLVAIRMKHVRTAYTQQTRGLVDAHPPSSLTVQERRRRVGVAGRYDRYSEEVPFLEKC